MEFVPTPPSPAPEAQAPVDQGAQDTFLTEAKEVFGHEFSSRDEIKNQWSELNGYKTKYEETTGRFGELENKAKLAEEYESLPLVAQFKDFMKNLDPSDPAKALQQVSDFTKVHATDWDALAAKDPLTVLIEKEYAENNGEIPRAQVERMVRKQYKLDPDQYPELDEEAAKMEAEDAMVLAVKEARKATEFFKSKRADFSKHPANGAREAQNQRAQEFSNAYKAAIKEVAGSLKELEFGDFKYKVDGEPGAYTKAAAESPDQFFKSLVLDDKGANYDPGKIMKMALILDHMENMIKASAGTAKAAGIQEVFTDAARTIIPGSNPHQGEGRKPIGAVPPIF